MVIVTNLEEIKDLNNKIKSNAQDLKKALDEIKNDKELVDSIKESYEKMHSDLKLKEYSVN